MSDSLILNHAARVLSTVAASMPADAALRQYFAGMRRLGPREKRAISRAVFTFFRWLQWLDQKQSAQKQVQEALNFQQRFDKDPRTIKSEALAVRAVPDWVRAEVELPVETLRLWQREPTLWLRARPDAWQKVRAALGDCEGAPPAISARLGDVDLSTALRYRGPKDLFLTPEFHAGAFEIQDLASQLVGYACAPRPGETWWDACAGEGGKMLHLADLMQNKGLIWATDRSERRLQLLKRRATRAKIFNYRTATWDGSSRLPTKTRFNGVLLDAPCSGLGTWQRNPHARWTTHPQDVAELAIIQKEMLEAVSAAVKPGGRLVYSVCTLTRRETLDIAADFTARHRDFEPVAVFPNKHGEASLSSPACDLDKTGALDETQITLWPHELNANGMFIATWKKL